MNGWGYGETQAEFLEIQLKAAMAMTAILVRKLGGRVKVTPEEMQEIMGFTLIRDDSQEDQFIVLHVVPTPKGVETA